MLTQSQATSEYVRGVLYGLAAVNIWAGFIVVARLGIRSVSEPVSKHRSPLDFAVALIKPAAGGVEFGEMSLYPFPER